MLTDYTRRPFGKVGLAAVLFCVVPLCADAMWAQGPLPGSPAPATAPVETNRAFAATLNGVVADVRIKGNETVRSEEILRHLRTRKDRVFDPEVLQADKRRLITQCKLRDVRIYTQRTGDAVVVTFEVFERPTIRSIQFIGNRGIGDKTLLKHSGMAVGDAMNTYSIEEARRRIEDHYRTKGFPKAEVTVAEGRSAEDQGVAFYISEGQLQRISSVSFVGNTIASDARLKTMIQSKPGYLWYLIRGKVDEGKIAQDVDVLTEYYRGLGFFRARISRLMDYDDSGKWLALQFVIDEGPRYVVRNVSVMGCEQFRAGEMEQDLELQSGEYFNLSEMNVDVNTLRDIYGMHGYIFADIQADPRFLEEPGQLDLVYSIDEGQQFRVGDINVHIAGEFPHTQESVILDRLSFRPGDIVDIRQVRASERRLKASQLFIVNPTEGAPPRIVIKPPDLTDVENLASRRSDRSVRGQSPDAGSATPSNRKIDLDVYVIPSSQ